MKTTETTKFQQMLEAKEHEIVSRLRVRDHIAVERLPDELDAIQLAGIREMAIENLNRESEILRQIREARARIAEGTYGVCEECGQAISPRRLEAIPWAAYCVRCQETIDLERAHAGEQESDEDLLNLAA